MTSYLYIPSINKYLCSRGYFLTDDDLEYYDRMEKEWKNSQQRYTFPQLMKIFPEAIKPARKAFKERIKQFKQKIKEVNETQEEYYNERIIKAHFTEQEELKQDSDQAFEAQRKEWTSKIKTSMFCLSHLDELEGKEQSKTKIGVDEVDIMRAKEIPLETFYTDHLHKHGKLAVGCCPFHGEKTPSFTIYLDQNTWWCFGCNKGGSVIDFVMQQSSVDFLTAVKQILK